ncbi:MAG: methyltransferase domain-containing protein [Verrucomicrobia bacterium]|nr:methyltransferase domain-containing protein [Verrucomicrobiota bacterium]
MSSNWLFPERSFDAAERELMDEDQPISPELICDLHNLQRLNRWFGSYALVEHFLRRWFRPGHRASLLDFCTATADIPRYIVDWGRARAVAIRVDAVDFQASTLALAEAQCACYPEIRLIRADVTRFQPEAAYDYVFCSLALHHFSDAQAVALLRRARMFARKAVLIADIERSDLSLLGIYLLTELAFRQRMTRHDARMSMRRAFAAAEFRALARQAGWQHFGYRRFPVARHAIWLENPGVT